HITDLYEDLRDGHNLISLLEVLSGVTLPREKGRMRFHRLQNVQIALDFLKQRQVKLVNIRNDDITDGNPKLTLGLIWTIILHFQISEIYVSGESGDLTAKEKLLLWSQKASEGWPGLRCTNFSSSWSDGRMFNALLHRFRPDLIDMEVVAQQSNLDNLEQAFEIAESLGVTRLLDAEDVDVPSPDEKSVITYVSSIYDAFPKIPEGGEGIAAHEVDHRWAEYRSRFSMLLQWSRQHKALMANKNFPLDPVELKALYNEYVHFKETEIPAKELEKGRVEHLYKLLEVWMEFGRIKLPLGLHPNDLEEEWGKLILEMLEREKALRPADMSLVESGEAVRCERELGLYLQDCEVLIRQLNLDLNILRDEKYYQVEQLAFRSVAGEGNDLCVRQDVLERAEWGADLPSVEQNLQDHQNVHTAVEELLHSLKEARNYELTPSNISSSRPLSSQELSSWRLRCLESLHAFVCRCTEELIWLNEREEEELAYDWSQNNTNVNAKRELYAEMRSELEEKQEVMHSLQETADRLCQENHPAKQTVEAYSAALQTQWQWVRQLCVCVEQHLKDNTTYFQFVSDARDCETYLRQLQDTIKRQYTCDKSSRLGKLEDLLQDSMEKEQLIEYRSSVASLVGRAKTVVQLRPRSAESTLGSTTPIRAICDYRQIEITISRGEECVLADNSQRTKWKVISPSGNEAMVPSVCFTVPPPNQEAMDTASRMEQLYQNVMSLWHNLHVSMKSVVSWHYLQKDIRTVSSWMGLKFNDLSCLPAPVCLHLLSPFLYPFLCLFFFSSFIYSPPLSVPLFLSLSVPLALCPSLFLSLSLSPVEKDESVSRSYLSELQNIKLRLEEAEQRLMRGIQTPPPSNRSGDSIDNTVQIKLQSDLDGLRTSLGEVSRRCVSFFEEKPTSSSVPLLRSELNLAVEKIDRLHNLSSVYLHKLKTVDVLMYSLQAAESQVKRYESRLSEEDIVPADTNAIQALREQLGTWQSELEDQEGVFSSLQSEVQKAREAGTQLNRLHPDRSPELERYQEKAAQLTERWAGALVADIEKNQTKLDECQTHSKQYCTSVKDYELQLMTFRAFVESTQKSTGKRRRMHSSSDAITQEFMDLRTRYTALVTLTTQHVKYISDALRRLEEEEKEVEEERQQRVGQVSELLGWVKGLQGRAGDPSAESSIAAQEVQKYEMHLVIRNTQVFLMSKQYSSDCLTQYVGRRKLKYSLYLFLYLQSQSAIGGVIDLGTMETVPVFQAAQRGLIDLDTCHVLLEAQLTVGGLFQPDSPGSLSLEEGLNCGLIDSHISQSLSELESALHLVDQTEQLEGQLLPVAAAMEEGLIKEEVGLRILELQINTGGLKDLGEGRLTLNSAGEMDLLTPRVYSKLCSRVNRRELIDPNTADKLNLSELQQRCVLSDDTGLYLLPVKQQPGGTVCLRSGRKVGIFRAVQEGLIDRQVAVRLLEAQLFAGGISDPRSGHLLTVNEAVRHNLMNQDLACAMLTRQLQYGGILDPVTGDRLGVEEAIQTDLLSPHLALLVLESLWAFIGMLWPESGELLPIAEALQQGVISQELAWNILRQRHAIGALYLPETPKVVSLNQAKEVLEPKVAEILKEIQIPDVLHNMNQSGSPKLNRLIWGSTGTSHPPSSSPGLNCDPSFLEKMAPEEQAHHRLLFHVMTHSYVDAHSGQRLVLLEPELVELVKAAAGLISVDSIPGVVEEGLSLTTERQECMEVAPDVCLPDTPQTREVGKVQEKSAIFSLPEKYTYPRKMAHQTGIKEMGQVDLDSTMRISEEVDGGVHREVKGEKDEMVSFESAPPSAGLLETQVTDSYEDGLVAMESEGSRESGHRKAKEEDSLVEDVDSPLVEALEMYSTPVKPETLMPTQYFKEPDISPSEADEKESVPVSVEVNYAVKDTPRVTEKTLPQVMGLEAAAVKTEEDVELERLASELQQGGLLTEGGARLLLSSHNGSSCARLAHSPPILQVLYCTLFLCIFKCPITDLCSDSAYTLRQVQLFLSSFSTFFFLPQELQSSLSARSNDVNTVAFDIQVFISERAQDLAPEQSRHLLGQLQQLQRGFHQAAGQAHTKADALAAQREMEEERQRREICYTTCNPSISDHLSLSLPQEVQKDLLTRGEGVAETIRSVEEFLAEHGDSLSPEERANLQGALSRMKEQYSALTDTAQSSLVQLDTAISTTVQQNTQRVRVSAICLICIFMDTVLIAELQQLQAQQAQLMQVSQNARSLLDQPDSAVPAEEKRRLRDQLDQLQTQHQEKLRACQERLRRSEALKDELAKFLQEHGGLGTWLEQSEGELGSLGEGETDAQGLKGRLEEHRKLAEDVICHKADLRFVSISGQKVLDSVQGALEKLGGSDPALEETKQLVTGKLQDANHRYTALHTKVITTPTLSPLPLPLSEPDGLEKRFSSLSESMSERAEQLQTSVAQSVSVQEGLKGLLAWLDGLLLTPGPVQPTAQKLRQELLSRQGSVEATCDSVSKLLQSSDASTASGLQASLESLTQSYTAAQAKQAEREAELRGLLPKLENYERLSADLQGFTQTCLRALSPVGQPDLKHMQNPRRKPAFHQTLGEDFTFQQDNNLHHKAKSTLELLSKKYNAIQSCEQQLGQFRSLSGSLLRWLQTTQEQLPLKEPNVNTEALQRRVQQLKVCVCLFFKLLHGLITLLQKTLQVAVAEVNCRYEELGEELKDRQSRQEASLELRQKARQSTEELSRWLGDRENSLHLGQTAASPSKPEVVRAQAQENKVSALLSELAEHSGKVKELKSTLEKLIADNPDSPEADTWRQQMKEIDSRWAKANEAAVQRQVELETCADRLGSFATAASQLGPWLKEKELMMSVLGPLSIDPNMLNTQNQQVQFMLREFDTRRPQFDQLTQAAEGILSPSGGDSSPQDAKDLAEVRSELGSISQQWDDLTQRLSRRSGHIGQAQGTSERYQALLKNLSVNVGALGERLDGQASLSAQPEALKRRLQETGEIRSELEQRREELGEAEKLCGELSAIVVEPYLRDELKKRLETDGLSQLQAALSSTQQFQQMFEELRSWLDNQSGQRDSTADSLPCQPEAIRTLLAQQDELHRGVASQRGPYELIQAEGASLLASLPAGGEERSALLSRLTALRQDWDELNQCITERQNRLKSALTKAESYQQHRAELTPWVVECEEREADIQLSLDPAALDEALQKARQLGLDLERRRPLLEALNIAADQLLEHCRVGEEDVRDEKAQLNRRVDGLAENLQNRVSQLEELAGRLKEFEDGRQAVERRLEAARHQIEVQEALGPQACSNKSLERLRSQQETLQSLQPQVAYLRDLAQGLVQDAPHTAGGGGGGEGGQRLEHQEHCTIEKCCSTLESRLQGVGEVQSSVRDLFSHLADLDDELDSLSPVGRDADSLASQADAVHAFLARLATLRSELEGHGGDCTAMLRREGSSPDLLALRRETEALSRQAGKLSERGQARVGQIEVAAEKVAEFYAKVAELQGLLGRAEEGLNAQGVVGTEVETIKQQLHEFKQVDSIQPKLQRVNAVGQGLIQSAAKHTDTQALEHDLETTNLRWNSLNKRVAERIAQLQEALLHCGKFQDALEPLLSWLSDTEDLVANQKPPSAEYRVVKAQIQEQKLLQRLLDDRRATFQMIQGEGERIAATAETQDRDKIQKQLESLGERWGELLEKARARQCQLEELQTLALQFHEAVEPLGEWLSATERRLSTAEPMGTQTSKITQQITKHKSLNEEIVSRKKQVDQAIKNGQALLKQTTGEEVLLIQEKLDGIKSRYAEMTGGSSRALRTLEQALQLSTRFASAHDDLNHWLDKVEAELNVMEPDATPAYQDRQKVSLTCVSAEKRLVLDTVNEVGNALLDLVPWRAREGLDRLVADANQRYRTAAETITQRVKLVQAAIQRSQQYEEAVDAELTWAGETERKLSSLGPLSLEPDVTVAQLQVQRAFNIDIIRHKDTVDQLLHTRDDILETCSDQQRDEKTDSLSARYEAVSQQHQERFSALEQAQVLVARFWETQEDLEPWLGETETLIAQLPPPAIDTEALRLQQEQMRLLRESIAEHKPHIDKLLKIGPQLAALSHQEGATVKQRYSDAEKRYVAIKEVVKGRATTLDEAVSQSAQFHDKMDPLLETLEGAVQRLRSPPPVAAEADKIREQLADHKATGLELDKLLPSFSALCARGEELITVRSRLLRLRSLWDEIRQRAEEREGKLTDVLDLAGKFWADMAALLSTLRDSQDIVRELEDPGVDPSLIKQQIEAAEAIKAETDGLREELEFVRTLGADLIFACGETEKPEVKKTIDEMNAAWEGLNRTWRERMERLEEAMTASVQYQDALQSMFDYLDNAVIKLCDMSTVGTDLGTVKQQIEELKHYKVEVYQQQIDMEKLCHQGELLLKKVSDQTDRDMIQEPLTELRHLWDNLGDKITHRQHKLEGALLALGQFQHALSELQSWLSHTHATLDTQRPVNSDPKAIEIELAKHHVLRNDVLSHRSTVETVNAAGAELLESSPGDEANHLRGQLDHLNRGWENLLLKTQDRQKLLEAALHQAEGFHGELEEFLQWLRRTESQLSAAKPTGGLPETAREQLQQHLELQTQLAQRAEQYNRLLDAGESMLLSRGGEERGPGAGTTQTQQNLALLQNKWASLNTKMDDRTAKLDEAVSLATGFQSSLQDTINWLTQAEQTLNMAQPPSLILDTVLFQIDEHKVFVNEVNTHREQVLALEKAGSQLRFASIKQDVVLIKNLLLSVQARWDKLVQRSLDRGRHLDEARKRAKQFHEAWRKLSDWLEEAESRLDSELEISNEPDKIRVQLTKHKEFQKALGSKQPVYDTTVRSGKAMRDKATLPEDTQKLDHLLGEVRDKWDTVCGKSVERQHKLEEALLFSGQFAEALQALVDWLYRVEPQLAEDLPVHGDLDLVSNLMDSHKAFQKELGKRTTSVHALKRSARELMETGRDDTAWVKVQLQELSNRWDTVCALSVTKQTRLQQALKQAEEFRTAVRLLLEWLSEAEQTLRFRGVLPEEAETLQALLHTHRNFMATVEEKRTDVNRAAGQGEAILTACQADCITTIKHWITIIRARFEEVLTWAKQHEQRLETALTELLNNATLLEELLSWLQWAETTLVQRDGETLPQDIPQLKTLITEHQVFMEEMTRKQPDVDKVTKTYKRKPAEPPSSLAERRGVAGGNPRLTQLCSRWQQVWLLALDRQRKLNDALDRLEELKEFASFDFDVWRKKYMRWMNHKKSRVMDFFRRIDKDQDGKITRQEFIDGILASKFPTSRLEMTAVADIFDQDGDGYIDYYEFVAALHPNKDAYRPTTDADKIEDEVTRQVAQCKCAKRFQVEQIGENKYRFFLGNQFGDSQQLRLVRILRSTVMVRVGGGWMALDEFLVKNDPCRVQHPGLKILRSDSSSTISSRIARGRTNLELREKFILPEGASQGLAAFRSRGRRSKPGSRTASPTRSSSSASHSAHSCASLPSTPGAVSGSKLKRPTFHSSRGSLTGENGGATPTSTKPGRTDPRRTPSGASGAASRAGSRAGSRASSRRGSDASDASELLETRSACSDTSDTPRRPGAAKPSKIPTISKKAPSPKTPASGKK
uniref:Microtubule actin crosslinking factor 1 n=1 Tax=Oncorhynchus mykiss TaxID=8022 RepID=A0A8C7WFL5_ONCMY